MRRLKDRQFNTEIQNIMNGFLDEQTYDIEGRKELSGAEIIKEPLVETIDDELPF